MVCVSMCVCVYIHMHIYGDTYQHERRATQHPSQASAGNCARDCQGSACSKSRHSSKRTRCSKKRHSQKRTH